MYTKKDENTLRKTETKEVVSEYDIPSVKEQLEHMKSEVARLEGIISEAKKLGIKEKAEV